MRQAAVPAFKDRLSDPRMMAPATGVVANVLQSCARSIDVCYRNTGVPGTDYSEVVVFQSSVLNPHMGSYAVNTDRKPLIVGIAPVKYDFLPLEYNSYMINVEIEARVFIQEPPLATSIESVLTSDMYFRDLQMRSAIMDALNLALLYVPYYKGNELTNIDLHGVGIHGANPMSPVISVTYQVPATAKLNRAQPAKLTVVDHIKDQDGSVSYDLPLQNQLI